MYDLLDPSTLQPLPTAVQARVLGSPMRTRMGMELLKADLSVDRAVRGLGAGSVAHDIDKTIHGSCSFALGEQLPWGAATVRPYALITAAGTVARANLGAYALATPATVAGQPFAVTGYDRLHYLDRFLPDTYVVTAGTDVLTAMRQAIADSGLPPSTVQLDTSAAGRTVPTDKSWPLLTGDASERGGYTWLNVFNDLGMMIGYRAAWCDDYGRYRSGPYLTPSQRPVAWTLDASQRGLGVKLSRARQKVEDLWDLPNRWTFYQRNPAPGAAPLTYTRTDTAGVTKRGGLLWPAQPEALDAADQAGLEAAGNARADADLLRAAKIDHATSPLPNTAHADIFAVVDPLLGVAGKVQSNNWTTAWSTAGLLADTVHGWSAVAS